MKFQTEYVKAKANKILLIIVSVTMVNLSSTTSIKVNILSKLSNFFLASSNIASNLFRVSKAFNDKMISIITNTINRLSKMTLKNSTIIPLSSHHTLNLLNQINYLLC